jgi:type I restriction enzyme M protein
MADIETNGYNLDLHNPNGPNDLAHRPPVELLTELMETEEEIMQVLCEIEQELAK